jgi:hypothetical protein
MKDCQAIDALPIEQLRAEFGDIMAEIVTSYGDDAKAVAASSDTQGQDQQQESEAHA